MQSKKTGKCPVCGAVNPLIPHPDKPGRVVMFCKCNQSGPVLETDAEPAKTEEAE